MTSVIAELRELHAKATPGEWYLGWDKEKRTIRVDYGSGSVLLAVTSAGKKAWEAASYAPSNAAFIVAAHMHLPTLLDEIERLSERLATAERDNQELTDALAEGAAKIDRLTGERDALPTVGEDPAGKGYPCFFRPMTAQEINDLIASQTARAHAAEQRCADIIEQCAKVADSIEDEYWAKWKSDYDMHDQGMSNGAGAVATAIRNLAQTTGEG